MEHAAARSSSLLPPREPIRPPPAPSVMERAFRPGNIDMQQRNLIPALTAVVLSAAVAACGGETPTASVANGYGIYPDGQNGQNGPASQPPSGMQSGSPY